MSVSQYKSKKLLDHANNVTPWTAPTAFWVALYKSNPTASDTVGTEVSTVIDDTAYARQPITWAAAVLANEAAVSSDAQTFAATVYGSGAAAYTANYFGIRDGSNATISAGSFVVGNVYTIVSVGTTSFTGIGASANTIGTIFTATGVGAGTGTAAWSGNLLDFNQLVSPIVRTAGQPFVINTGYISSSLV